VVEQVHHWVSITLRGGRAVLVLLEDLLPRTLTGVGGLVGILGSLVTRSDLHARGPRGGESLEDRNGFEFVRTRFLIPLQGG
jgi:hypothetical protein